jgi:hypothetical protein
MKMASLQKTSTRYAILSSLHNQMYFDNAERSADQIKFYTQIRQSAKLIKDYSPFPYPNTIRHQWQLFEHAFRTAVLAQNFTPYYNGPLLEIYKFPD